MEPRGNLGLFLLGERKMESRICKYKKCRLEAEPQEEYCKYHKKLNEIEKQRPPWLKDMIEEVRVKRERDRVKDYL